MAAGAADTRPSDGLAPMQVEVAHRRIADRIAAAFLEQGGERWRMVARETEVRDAETGRGYWPEIVLLDGSSNIHTVVEVDESAGCGDGYSRRGQCYRAIPSLQNYVIALRDKAQITWYSRLSERQWLFGAADDIHASAILETPPVTLSLSEVYEGVLAADAHSA